jgi:hypothetical protein
LKRARNVVPYSDGVMRFVEGGVKAVEKRRIEIRVTLSA